MIMAGVYQRGTNEEIDLAIDKHDAIEAFLMQEEEERCTIEDTLQKLSALAEIEIPEEEYSESPASVRKSVSEIIQEERLNAVHEENSRASEIYSGREGEISMMNIKKIPGITVGNG